MVCLLSTQSRGWKCVLPSLVLQECGVLFKSPGENGQRSHEMKHRFLQEVTPAFIQRCPGLGFKETSAGQEAVAPVMWNTVSREGQSERWGQRSVLHKWSRNGFRKTWLETFAGVLLGMR